MKKAFYEADGLAAGPRLRHFRGSQWKSAVHLRFPVFQRRVQLRISLRASTLCSYWQISSLYAARNTSPLQIVIKADVTPRRSSTIGFTGPGCFTSSRDSTTCINRKGGGGYMKIYIYIYNERWWTTKPL